MKQLSRGEAIVLGAALALLVSSFLPLWATANFAPFPGIRGSSESFNAWSPAFGVLLRVALVLTIAAIALIVVKAVAPQILPLHPDTALLAISSLALLLMLLVLLNGPEFGNIDEAQARLAGINIGRGLMLFVATGLAAVMAYGAFLNRTAPEAQVRGRA